jgi:hypothetical protein
MKKTIGLTVIGVLVTLAFTSLQVFASNGVEKGKPTQMPGLKATEKADERATETSGGQDDNNPGGKPDDKGKPDGKGKPEDSGKPDDKGGNKANYRGMVASIDDSSLTITLKDGSSITFLLNADTRIQIPSLKDATPGDLSIGGNVMVQAAKGSTDELTARHIVFIPGKPLPIHRVGIVTDYQPGVSITIQDKQGNAPSTFTLDAETKILPADRAEQLAAGTLVTIISRRDVTGAAPSAFGIVVHPEKFSQTPVITETVIPEPIVETTPTP